MASKKNSFMINLVQNKSQYFQKWQFFYPLSVHFHLITSLILIISSHTKLKLLNNFCAPMPNKRKVGKNRKIFSSTIFVKLQKIGDLCGHKWPEWIMSKSEKNFKFMKFVQKFQNSSKLPEMVLFQLFFHF